MSGPCSATRLTGWAAWMPAGSPGWSSMRQRCLVLMLAGTDQPRRRAVVGVERAAVEPLGDQHVASGSANGSSPAPPSSITGSSGTEGAGRPRWVPKRGNPSMRRWPGGSVTIHTVPYRPMATVRTPRARWIDEALRALAAGGPDGVRVEPLAKAIGVTKGGFYWHFADRGALLEEMLDTWERTSIDEIIERVEAEGGDARAGLRRLFRLADAADALLTTDLAIRDWSRRDARVAERLRRVDNRRMDYLRSLFRGFLADEEEVEARSMIAFSLWIGNRFMAADHGTRSRREVLALVLRRLEA
jgi:AcrR family transcriptional regulator